MKWLLLLSIGLLSPFIVSNAEDAWEVCDVYVKEALDANQSLNAERLRTDLAKQDIRGALGAMMPSVELKSRFTRADGGREIRFDVNDFLPSDVLPADVPPSVIPFLREYEQETKLAFSQPIFAGGVLYHSWRANQDFSQAEEAAVHAKEAEIAYQTRKTLFHWLSSVELIKVAEKDTLLAFEQLRAAKLRKENDMANAAEVHRANASLADSRARLIEAGAREQLARTSLNRVLGRDLMAKPDIEAIDEELPRQILSLDSLLAIADRNRGELLQLHQQRKALSHALKASNSAWLPLLAVAGEYGYQGEEFRLNDEHDYYMLSAVLEWNLFDGFQKNAQRQRFVIERRQLDMQTNDANQAIQQDVTAAWLQQNSSLAKHKASLESKKAADENYRIVNALYQEGMAQQLELLDAQKLKTQAAVGEISSRYTAWIAQADVWRSVGFILKDKE